MAELPPAVVAMIVGLFFVSGLVLSAAVFRWQLRRMDTRPPAWTTQLTLGPAFALARRWRLVVPLALAALLASLAIAFLRPSSSALLFTVTGLLFAGGGGVLLWTAYGALHLRVWEQERARLESLPPPRPLVEELRSPRVGLTLIFAGLWGIAFAVWELRGGTMPRPIAWGGMVWSALFVVAGTVVLLRRRKRPSEAGS